MTTSRLNYGAPEVLEAQRIAEIKALSYLERLERMFALFELSYKIRKAYTINLNKNEPSDN